MVYNSHLNCKNVGRRKYGFRSGTQISAVFTGLQASDGGLGAGRHGASEPQTWVPPGPPCAALLLTPGGIWDSSSPLQEETLVEAWSTLALRLWGVCEPAASLGLRGELCSSGSFVCYPPPRPRGVCACACACACRKPAGPPLLPQSPSL